MRASGRPGFYFRVLREGDVGEGDEILKVGEAAARMTVAEINALLYLPHHARDNLERALRIEALSNGWRRSFKALLQSQQNGASTGNAGLAPAAAAHPAAPGFGSLGVTAIDHESADVRSLTMESPDGQPLPNAQPGQYVVVRFKLTADGPTLFRSYSLSGPPLTHRLRISVKIEPNGTAGTYLRDHVRWGDLTRRAYRRERVQHRQNRCRTNPGTEQDDRSLARLQNKTPARRADVERISSGCTQRVMGGIIRLPAKSAASCAR